MKIDMHTHTGIVVLSIHPHTYTHSQYYAMSFMPPPPSRPDTHMYMYTPLSLDFSSLMQRICYHLPRCSSTFLWSARRSSPVWPRSRRVMRRQMLSAVSWLGQRIRTSTSWTPRPSLYSKRWGFLNALVYYVSSGHLYNYATCLIRHIVH